MGFLRRPQNLRHTFDKSDMFNAHNSVLVKKSTKIFKNKCVQIVLYKLYQSQILPQGPQFEITLIFMTQFRSKKNFCKPNINIKSTLAICMVSKFACKIFHPIVNRRRTHVEHFNVTLKESGLKWRNEIGHLLEGHFIFLNYT